MAHMIASVTVNLPSWMEVFHFVVLVQDVTPVR